MVRHLIVSFLRNAKKHLHFHVLNISCLSVGIASSALLFLYCRDELTFDRLHEKHERIFKVVDTYTFSDGPVNSATISAPMGPTLVETIPEVQMCVRLNKVTGIMRAEIDSEKEFQYERILFADSGFFQLFSFPLLEGEAATVLTKPNTIVLTEKVARQLFGKRNPMGQLIRTNLLGGQTMMVTGIAGDPPTNSHIQYDALISHTSMINVVTTLNHWLVYGTHTYILINGTANAEDLRTKFKDLVGKHVDPELAAKYDHHVVPIESIHLGINRRGDLEPGGNLTMIYILIAVGVLIVVLATVNFVSLSISVASNRMRESGVRQSLGGSRLQLVVQFLFESVVLSAVTPILVILIATASLEGFNLLAGKSFTLRQLLSPTLLTSVVILCLLSGIIAGLFPALFLARLNPVIALRKIHTRQLFDRQRLKSAAVIIQFTIVIALLIGVEIVGRQLNYFRNHDLGFTKKGILVVPINSPLVAKHRIALEAELSVLPSVLSVSTSSTVPSKNTGIGPFRLEGGSLDDNAILNVLGVDAGYFHTLQLSFVAGRPFERDRPSDSTSFILNERAVNILGIASPEQAIGKTLEMHGPNKETGALKRGPIVGVTKDFHFKSLREEVEPLVMHINKGGHGYYLIRFDAEDVQEFIDRITATWRAVEPGQAMMYSFLDDDLDSLYTSEKRLEKIFSMFNVLTIIIGCVGLFGLSSYTILRRAKEIAVRKVHGARPIQIMFIVVSAFIKMWILSFALACPLVYYVASQWLSHFAYHEVLQPTSFLIAGIMALLVMLITIVYHVVKYSYLNPVYFLRSE